MARRRRACHARRDATLRGPGLRATRPTAGFATLQLCAVMPARQLTEPAMSHTSSSPSNRWAPASRPEEGQTLLADGALRHGIWLPHARKSRFPCGTCKVQVLRARGRRRRLPFALMDMERDEGRCPRLLRCAPGRHRHRGRHRRRARPILPIPLQGFHRPYRRAGRPHPHHHGWVSPSPSTARGWISPGRAVRQSGLGRLAQPRAFAGQPARHAAAGGA